MTTESVFHSILVPVDGSPLAATALPLASGLAHAAGAHLRLALVHTMPPAPADTGSVTSFASVDVAGRASERSYLQALEARLREAGTRIASSATLTGAVGSALADYVRDHGIDLVVMATHGRGGVRRAWLGSVADYLIRHLEVPVLLVRPHDEAATEPPAARGILVPLDGSPLGEAVLRPAAALARIRGTGLTLVQVVPPVLEVADMTLPLAAAVAVPGEPGMTELLQQEAQDYLDALVAELRTEGIPATGTAVVGYHVAKTIQELARPERFGLIAMATHGRGGVRRLALGSVADKLVRSADVPVLIHRPAEVGDLPRPRTRREVAAAG
ncbi:MAG TPA: universal stress protein [Gemmatimonadales bacterium]|nr:universal stress protein [Gemmatimonadales bacterium]